MNWWEVFVAVLGFFSITAFVVMLVSFFRCSTIALEKKHYVTKVLFIFFSASGITLWISLFLLAHLMLFLGTLAVAALLFIIGFMLASNVVVDELQNQSVRSDRVISIPPGSNMRPVEDMSGVDGQ